MKQYKVSVIVPVYNTGELLRSCLESLVNQTIDIEIIIINDNSSDNSFDIIIEYAKKYSNIRVLNNPVNIGCGLSRNRGIKISQGEFIGFCDSDDYVDKNYFEYLYNQSNGYDIIFGERILHNLNGEINRSKKNPYGCIIPAIIRKSFLDEFNIKFPRKKVGEDSVFKRLIINKNPRINYTKIDNGPFYHYVFRRNSLSNYS